MKQKYHLNYLENTNGEKNIKFQKLHMKMEQEVLNLEMKQEIHYG